jgi:hypothetical protein
MAGAIAGVRHGAAAIPTRRLDALEEGLRGRTHVARLADRLARAEAGGPGPDAGPSPGPVVARRPRARRRRARARSSGRQAGQSCERGSRVLLVHPRELGLPASASASCSRPGLCPMTRTEPTSGWSARRRASSAASLAPYGPSSKTTSTSSPRAPSTRSSVSRARRAGEHSTSSGRIPSALRDRRSPARPASPPRERPVAVGERPVLAARLGMTQQIHALHRTHPLPTEHPKPPAQRVGRVADDRRPPRRFAGGRPAETAERSAR